MRSRVFNIMQYAAHPETGETLLTEATITAVLGKYKSIKQWAWIAHDHDVDADGNIKPLHYHIVIYTGSTPKDTSDVARWLGIAENFVDVPRGHKGRGMDNFRDCVAYLTHENLPERGLYADEAVHANFDWRYYVDTVGCGKSRAMRQRVDAWISSILHGNATLADCLRDDEVLYVRNLRTLRDAQAEYISYLPVPDMRMNFLVTGESAMGKTTLAKALARSLCPEYKTDEACYHFVGSKDVPFELYAGQPVIIWDDARPETLLHALGGRDNLFRVFDPHPTRAAQNIKYGKINLVNKYNIFTSVLSYETFLDGLAGQYKNRYGELVKSESRVQSYRRFPVIFQIRLEDFCLLINSGWSEANTDFLHFREVMRFVSGVWRLRAHYQAQQIPAEIAEARARDKESAVLVPVVDEIKKLMPPEHDASRDYAADMDAIDAELIGGAEWTYPEP